MKILANIVMKVGGKKRNIELKSVGDWLDLRIQGYYVLSITPDGRLVRTGGVSSEFSGLQVDEQGRIVEFVPSAYEEEHFNDTPCPFCGSYNTKVDDQGYFDSCYTCDDRHRRP